MRTLAIGGNSRNVGKTGLAVSMIEATRDLRWTAVKVTQFGHGICSRSGAPCGCAVTDPLCPYDLTTEDGCVPTTDTARMLQAGAEEVLWVRVALGQLAYAMPAIRSRLEGKPNVLFESNSIVEFWKPDVYLSVLQFDLNDFKESAKRLASHADAFVLPSSKKREPSWPGFDSGILNRRPVFAVEPPSYCTPAIVDFAMRQLFLPAERSATYGSVQP